MTTNKYDTRVPGSRWWFRAEPLRDKADSEKTFLIYGVRAERKDPFRGIGGSDFGDPSVSAVSWGTFNLYGSSFGSVLIRIKSPRDIHLKITI
ncbi:hypothetical protein GWI33_012074 [Rhynchophorus ferrugineus]|uniref:Uncharacterized protein n=1 Tax=Rhynchophorus ferrugineus TaxID=354439 RepID=A0A834IJG9_RHYFE|nr:hypothetical protein GWI33_012074 [Rhynchophorus ferrugineus]